MKRIAIICIMCLTACLAWAVEVEVNGIMYNVDIESKTAKVIYKESKYEGSIVIPSSMLVNDVECSVTSIGEQAFFQCSDLISVTIPEGVTSIGKSAFLNCSGLTFITIPESVTSIENFAFWGCVALTSITIPNSLTSIGVKVFSNCRNLTSITIPNSVTNIEEGAFINCTSLTSITIPNSVTNIGNQAFEDTRWYNNQPEGMVYAGLVAYKYKGTMPKNTSIIIQEGTKGIAGGAFYYCHELTSITIPNSVTNIGNYAFYDCI